MAFNNPKKDFLLSNINYNRTFFFLQTNGQKALATSADIL